MFDYIARQAILDKNLEIIGYELLYRSDEINRFKSSDATKASKSVILNAFMDIGIKKLSEHKPVFINFTQELILSRIAYLLPKDHIVIEMLENVVFDDKVLKEVILLHEKGYKIALDDFVLKEGAKKVLPYVDYLKIDFLMSSRLERNFIVSYVTNKNIKFIGEKIEKESDFFEAQRMGYTYFQGYHFSRPEMIKEKKLIPSKVMYFELMEEIAKEPIDIDKISDITSKDAVLTYKILQLINSVGVGLTQKVTSVKHAMHLLGEEKVKSWISLAAVKGISQSSSDVYIQDSLVRAKFLEKFASMIDRDDKSQQYFLLGLFSMLDLMSGSSMEEILSKVHVDEDIYEALVNGAGHLAGPYKIICSYERNDKDFIDQFSEHHKEMFRKLSLVYVEAVSFAKKIMEAH